MLHVGINGKKKKSIVSFQPQRKETISISFGFYVAMFKTENIIEGIKKPLQLKWLSIKL